MGRRDFLWLLRFLKIFHVCWYFFCPVRNTGYFNFYSFYVEFGPLIHVSMIKCILDHDINFVLFEFFKNWLLRSTWIYTYQWKSQWIDRFQYWWVIFPCKCKHLMYWETCRNMCRVIRNKASGVNSFICAVLGDLITWPKIPNLSRT